MGTDKAFIKVNGKSLLENAINICKPVCNSILISSNSAPHKIQNYQVVNDEFAGCGPIGGIYSCLKKSDSLWNFVISVDSPFVVPGFIENLVEASDGFHAVIPKHSGGLEPLIALYNVNCLPEIERRVIAGNYKMHNLLKAVKKNFVNSKKWLAEYPKMFQNLNYPNDLHGI